MVPCFSESWDRNHTNMKDSQCLSDRVLRQAVQFSNLGLYLILVVHITPLALMHWQHSSSLNRSKLCACPSLHNSVSFPIPLKSNLESFYLNIFPVSLVWRLEDSIHSEPVLVFNKSYCVLQMNFLLENPLFTILCFCIIEHADD